MQTIALGRTGAQQSRKRPANKIKLLPDLAETMGIFLLASILIASFSEILGGYLDVATILVITAICILRDGKLLFAAPIFIAAALTSVYGAIWTFSCTSVTCGTVVLATGRSVWQFSIYLLFFALLSRHAIVRITPKVVVASFVLFFSYLAITGQFTLIDSLRGLAATRFFNSYRFGIDNEINNINFVGLFCASLAPFAFPKHPRHLVGYVSMLLIALVIVATYSRSSLILFGILSLLSGFFLWRFSIGRLITLSILLVSSFALLVWLGYFEQRAFDFATDRSIGARLRVFGLLDELSPFGSKAALTEHFARRGAVDNTFLRHLVGGGFLVVLLIFALAAPVRRSFKQWSRGAPMTREALALFGWLLAIFFDDTFFSLWGAFLVANFVMPLASKYDMATKSMRGLAAIYPARRHRRAIPRS